MKYEDICEKIQVEIGKAGAVCLTTDCWTSITNSSYMAVTAHFIDGNMNLRSVCLSCSEFGERHTADNLAEILKSITSKWNIAYKISAIVSDNAANIVSGIRKTGYRQLPCFAHTLNLAVQKGLKDIEVVTSKVKSIVTYFKQSSHGQKRLNETQEQMGLPVLKLKQDVITRWNSTFEMLNRILTIKDAVISTLALLQAEDVETLNQYEWSVVERSVEVLKIFLEVTNEVSAEKYVTLSSILIFTGVMVNSMTQFNVDSSLPVEVNTMVETIKFQLEQRLKPLEGNELVTQAALLDPRFKKLAFCNTSSIKYNQAFEQLKNKVCLVSLPPTTSTATTISQTPSQGSRTASLIWKTFDEQFDLCRGSQNPTAAGIIELDKYMNEPLIGRHEDPLIWWSERKTIYPRLFNIVLKRLCIPATSVPCERLFSKAGLILRDRRSRLLTSKAEQVIFLCHNL